MVDLFEFLMVLESIIIGLGLAEILTGLGQLLRARRTARVYGVHAAVVGLILVSLLQHWWDAWGLREVGRWSFPGLLLFVLGPIILFLLAYLALPQTIGNTDLKDYYYEHKSIIWGLGAVYLLTTILFRPLAAGGQFLSTQNLVRGLGILLCIVLMSTRNRSVHVGGIATAGILIVVYVAFFSLWQTQ
jgi:hypothetical protein